MELIKHIFNFWRALTRAHQVKSSRNFTDFLTEIKIIDEEYFFIKDGRAMRHIPCSAGTRQVRANPPYWHRYNRVQCCEIGDSI